MEKYAEQTKQEFEGWDEFISKPVDEKLEAFKLNGRIFDVIYAQQFDREFLDSLGSLADMIRLLAKTKVGQSKLRHLLPHKRAMLYFVQPSTRTFLSFQNACHILGLTISEIRGTSTSSEVKGESPEDTIRHVCQLRRSDHFKTSGGWIRRKNRLGAESDRSPRAGFKRRFRTGSTSHPGPAGYLHPGTRV